MVDEVDEEPVVVNVDKRETTKTGSVQHELCADYAAGF
jgi:hypothetical protein